MDGNEPMGSTAAAVVISLVSILASGTKCYRYLHRFMLKNVFQVDCSSSFAGSNEPLQNISVNFHYPLLSLDSVLIFNIVYRCKSQSLTGENKMDLSAFLSQQLLDQAVA